MSDKITTCLWFDTEGEEAAQFYCTLFPNSRIVGVSHYGEAGPRAAGMVMTVDFELDGRPYVALNGGPDYRFTEAVSFQISCADQDEVDRYWDTLVADGGEGARAAGSRTASGCPGRSCPPRCPSCSPTRTRSGRTGRWPRC